MSEISKYSPELRDVIERPQSKWGLFVFCFLFVFVALLLTLSFIIKSPDIVIAEVKVSSSNPPIVLKSKSVGRIHFIVNNFPARADSGQYLAVIDNSADHLDVEYLKHVIEAGNTNYMFDISSIDRKIQLGELSSFYYALRNSMLKYKRLIDSNNEYNRELALLSKRLEYETKELASNKASFYNSVQQLQIKKKQHEEDSILYLKKAITESQYYESCLNILNSQKYIITGETEIIAKEKGIEENQQQIRMLSMKYEEELESSRIDMEAKYKEFIAQIRAWEDRYVFRAPSHCIVENANILSEGDYVNLGDPVFNCVFPNNSTYATALLPGQMSGKVHIGQPVNIKLESYPYSEYGMLKGYVERISMNSVDRGYLLSISLPNGLTSTSGRDLSFAETVYGQAEIITEERRLITRIYHQIYEMITSRRRLNSLGEDNNNQKVITL